jgi:hypothetical protein
LPGCTGALIWSSRLALAGPARALTVPVARSG